LETESVWLARAAVEPAFSFQVKAAFVNKTRLEYLISNENAVLWI
jgi:hypothetical protein